jgi:GNAT superfamily N-acetyltransferase
VAEDGGRVVGYVYAGLEPHSWKELREAAGFIHDVCVEDGQRSHGVGSLLVAAASDWLRARGAPRVLLWTAERNAAARRLVTRLGFRTTMVEMTREL